MPRPSWARSAAAGSVAIMTTVSGPRVAVDWFAPVLGMDGFVDYSTRLARGLAAATPTTAFSPDHPRWAPEVLEDVAAVERVTVAEATSRTERTAHWYDDELPRALEHAADDIDVVWAPAFFLPDPSPVPRVLTVHDLSFVHHPDRFSPENRALYVDRGRPDAERADAVLAISESTARDVVELWGVDPARVVVTLLGPTVEVGDVDREASRARAVQRLGLPAGGRFVVAVSPTHWRKNLRLVVREHQLLPVDLRRELPLVLVNADEPQTHQILGEEGRDAVVVLGRVDDDALRDLVAGAVALLHGSSLEGFGLPALNAMALGTPLVANDAPSLSEVGAGAARFVHIDERGSMAAAVAEVAQDGALAARLSAAGLRRAADFDWATTTARTLTTLRDVAAGSLPSLSVAAGRQPAGES